MSANIIDKATLRKDFSSALSTMFASEVPEYVQFTNIVKASNEAFLQKNPNAIIDPEHRVMAEKHGAIRVGTKEEMRTVTRIFGAFGMYPVEFYDMTQLPKGALPMVATAFRPIDNSIDKSAFRMFCSMLHPDYITDDIAEQVNKQLDKRRNDNPKFSAKLLDLLTISETKGLTKEQGKELIVEVVNAFRINKESPVDYNLYKKLREKNDVFADIVCLGININHLTPRAYDIQDAQKRLEDARIPMKDGGIEGPPIREDAPNIQLNQTSRKAPGEELFVSSDEATLSIDNTAALKASTKKLELLEGESVQDYLKRIEDALQTDKLLIIQHKARFGEIESRGTALTPEGEALYKELLADKRFKTDFPKTHAELFKQNLAYYTYRLTEKGRNTSSTNNNDLQYLLDNGYIELVPQTYNDFLAASAAGIFKSNMSTGVSGIGDNVKTETSKNKELLEDAMGRNIISRHDIHRADEAFSLQEIYAHFNMEAPADIKEKIAISIGKNPLQAASMFAHA
jgi:uncharacterized glyoxalase superfamily metalloenzyme YdcJ